MTMPTMGRDTLVIDDTNHRSDGEPSAATAVAAGAAAGGEPTLHDFVREAAAAKAAAKAATTPAEFMRQSAVAAALQGEADKAAKSAAAAAVAQSQAPSVADGGTPVEGTTLSAEELDELKQAIVQALKSVYDPEIPSDIYELGLIYRIDVDNDRNVEIDMTLTAPGCPVAGEMPIWVENAVGATPGVGGVKVNLVFDPPWDQSRMSDEAKLAVGMF